MLQLATLFGSRVVSEVVEKKNKEACLRELKTFFLFQKVLEQFLSVTCVGAAIAVCTLHPLPNLVRVVGVVTLLFGSIFCHDRSLLFGKYHSLADSMGCPYQDFSHSLSLNAWQWFCQHHLTHPLEHYDATYLGAQVHKLSQKGRLTRPEIICSQVLILGGWASRELVDTLVKTQF